MDLFREKHPPQTVWASSEGENSSGMWGCQFSEGWVISWAGEWEEWWCGDFEVVPAPFPPASLPSQTFYSHILTGNKGAMVCLV